MTSKSLVAASAAVSVLAGAGVANATVVGTLPVSEVSTSLVLTANLTGSGVLDDDGTFTVTDSGPGLLLGLPATIGYTDTFTGTYSSGTFTPTGGVSDQTLCTGLECSMALDLYPMSFTGLSGSITLAGGGTITADYTADGGAVTTTDVYSVAPVLLPPTVWLLGSGLLGLVGAARRRRG